MPNRRELGYVSAGSTSTVYVNGTATGYGVATGGTSSSITVSTQNYTLLTFTSDDNLVVSTAGLFDVLMFGGGGAGGRDGNNGGGGGAGGVLQSTVYLDAATYAVDVGAGGAGATGSAFDGHGLGSSIGTSARNLSVAGGGYGGGDIPGILGRTGAPGGCSGGNYRATGNGTAYNSGVSGFSGGTTAGGGGGGTTAVGAQGANGNGGAGYDVSAFISGSALYKGAGGGGASSGAGGSSIGGAASASGTAGSAAANTASGGGANGSSAGANASGSGGSGIVYIRFKV